jgi:hypothetical protein
MVKVLSHHHQAKINSYHKVKKSAILSIKYCRKNGFFMPHQDL